nr:ATP-binding cassette domain-containing protein [Deinococcus sp. GbtcB9]
MVGASGGGKTTLLRALAGLTPTRGTLRIGSGAPVRTRVMFQEDRLLPWLGALGNVALGLPRPDRFRAARALQDVASPVGNAPTRTNSAAGSGSGSPWPARSPTARTCSCSTSPSARSTP